MSFLDLFTTSTPDTAAPQPAPASKADKQVASALGTKPPTYALSLPTTLPPPAAPTTDDTDEVYQKLADKTNFDSTDVGKLVQKYLAPLASIPGTDAGTKIRIAIAQMKAQENVGDVDILAAFSELKAAVQHQIETFGQHSDDFVAKEVTAKLARIEAAKAEVRSLQDEINGLVAESSEAQVKASRLTALFNAAVVRRQYEITTQEAQVTALLKG
jgi:hypothetical protein